MTTHTPGPWIYGPETGQDCTRIDNEKGKVIAAVKTRQITSWDQSRPVYSWDEEGASNARLIASAPELLSALIVLRERHQIDDPHHAHLCEFCKQADSAIAKATTGVS